MIWRKTFASSWAYYVQADLLAPVFEVLLKERSNTSLVSRLHQHTDIVAGCPAEDLINLPPLVTLTPDHGTDLRFAIDSPDLNAVATAS